MAVIMIEKICKELPDMYIMNAFMGTDLAGARAISHAFFRKRSSVSETEGEGGVGSFFCREGGEVLACVSTSKEELEDGPWEWVVTLPELGVLPVELVKPGGLVMEEEAGRGLLVGRVRRSMTQGGVGC